MVWKVCVFTKKKLIEFDPSMDLAGESKPRCWRRGGPAREIRPREVRLRVVLAVVRKKKSEYRPSGGVATSLFAGEPLFGKS